MAWIFRSTYAVLFSLSPGIRDISPSSRSGPVSYVDVLSSSTSPPKKKKKKQTGRGRAVD